MRRREKKVSIERIIYAAITPSIRFACFSLFRPLARLLVCLFYRWFYVLSVALAAPHLPSLAWPDFRLKFHAHFCLIFTLLCSLPDLLSHFLPLHSPNVSWLTVEKTCTALLVFSYLLLQTTPETAVRNTPNSIAACIGEREPLRSFSTDERESH